MGSVVASRFPQHSSPYHPATTLTMPQLGRTGREKANWRTSVFPGFEYICVPDRDTPELDAWARAIVEAAVNRVGPVIIVARGVGCLATVLASSFQSQLIAGAVLVAPPDPAHHRSANRVLEAFPDFPTVLITGSANRRLNEARARQLAVDWGSEVVSTDTSRATGISALQIGLGLLERLCRRLSVPSRRAIAA